MVCRCALCYAVADFPVVALLSSHVVDPFHANMFDDTDATQVIIGRGTSELYLVPLPHAQLCASRGAPGPVHQSHRQDTHDVLDHDVLHLMRRMAGDCLRAVLWATPCSQAIINALPRELFVQRPAHADSVYSISSSSGSRQCAPPGPTA